MNSVAVWCTATRVDIIFVLLEVMVVIIIYSPLIFGEGACCINKYMIDVCAHCEVVVIVTVVLSHDVCVYVGTATCPWSRHCSCSPTHSALGGRAPMTWFQGLRMMFYALTPSESSFATPEEVPDYIEKVDGHTLLHACSGSSVLS